VAAVDETGMVHPAVLAQALCSQTAIVSVMHSNNEIGTINPIAELAAAARALGALFHADSVQAAAYLPVDVQTLGVDLLSLGAHKFYGPKGVGALYVRKGTPIHAMLTGGGQERGLRAGTSNVPYIAGFAEARAWQPKSGRPVRPMFARCVINSLVHVLESIPDARLTGHPDQRLPNHASFVFKDVDGNLLLQLLDAAGFACSSGSACKTGNPEPSEVIKALGFSREWALGSLRVTLGTHTTATDVKSFLDALPGLVERARQLNHR
jgi:cysteine desulfurase